MQNPLISSASFGPKTLNKGIDFMLDLKVTLIVFLTPQELQKLQKKFRLWALFGSCTIILLKPRHFFYHQIPRVELELKWQHSFHPYHSWFIQRNALWNNNNKNVRLLLLLSPSFYSKEMCTIIQGGRY